MYVSDELSRGRLYRTAMATSAPNAAEGADLTAAPTSSDTVSSNLLGFPNFVVFITSSTLSMSGAALIDGGR